MSPFDECGVLIPAATLEDLPSDLSDNDARSLLATWTVLWHPQLLADLGQIPTWYRADSPPDPVGKRILTVPTSSIGQLPDRFQQKCTESNDCRFVTGESRSAMLKALELAESLPDLTGESRTIGLGDFFAVGYATLQIQMMTRKLRYTSNLDEIHLQNRVVVAAKSFLEGEGQAAIEAMHDVFDCLAEERDHYFASDPHLVDLVLMTDTTLDRLVDQTLVDLDAPDESDDHPEPPIGGDHSPPPLPTPVNVLLDGPVVEAVSKLAQDKRDLLRGAISSGAIGWCGGGPSGDVCLDSLTFNQAEAILRKVLADCEQVLGATPKTLARFSGGCPADLSGALVRLGYKGAIPLDFASGTGFGDESKVVIRGGGAEIESLTAKPKDAGSDSAFVWLGARLGEAIDSGEIATALLAHWPGQSSDSFNDLRRVASWSLALGKFWKLDDYFIDGEHPYHHGNAKAASAGADADLSNRVAQGQENPIASAAAQFRDQVKAESSRNLQAMARLVDPNTDSNSADPESLGKTFAKAAGRQLSQQDPPPAILTVNPNDTGWRQNLKLTEPADKNLDSIYASSTDGDHADVTADVPALGFSIAQGGGGGGGFSIGSVFGLGKSKPIVTDSTLSNEFMDITISAETGAVSGVYSGGSRGNRFSLRLARRKQGEKPEHSKVAMKCDELKITQSTAATGTIETSGTLLDGDLKLARFEMRYTLNRGSRILLVNGNLTPIAPLGDDPWYEYLAARVAVANESSVIRCLLRDKMHRNSSRRLVSPMGVVIDESERQTLVSGDGLPYHVRVGDRFLDTLLAVKGESDIQFSLQYGFDLTKPVAAARSLLCHPMNIPVDAGKEPGTIGWVMHTSPKEIDVIALEVGKRDDGKLAAIVRVVQTRSKSASATLRFIHNVTYAEAIDSQYEDASDGDAFAKLLHRPLADNNSGKTLDTKGDQVTLPVIGHQVTDVLVVFDK